MTCLAKDLSIEPAYSLIDSAESKSLEGNDRRFYEFNDARKAVFEREWQKQGEKIGRSPNRWSARQ